MLGEAPHEIPASTEPLEQLRRILRPHQAEQRRPADDLQPALGEQAVEPAHASASDPRAFPARPYRRGPRRRSRAAPPTGQGPSAARCVAAISGGASAKLSRKPGEPVELAERAQHHDVAAPDLVGEAHAVGADIHEGLIDQQQAAAPPQTVGEREQSVLGDDPSVGIVGIDDDGDAGLGELRDLGDLDHVMAGKLGRARVLG